MTAPTIPTQRPEPDAANDHAWRLVELAQAGDQDALAELYRKYRAAVFNYVLTRVYRRHAIAEDLAGEVWERALRSLPRLERRTGPINWLMTIARNLVADYHKSGRSRLETLTSEMFDLEPDELNPPEAAAIHDATSAALLAAMQGLTPEQRRVLTLRYWRGLSVEETARAMSINTGAVKALQYRATCAMRRNQNVLALGGAR